MSRDRLFGELRSLLSRGERKKTWEALCEWVDRFDNVELEQIVFPYVEGHVRGWDASLCMAPRAWVQRTLDGEVLPFWGMVRGLDLSYEYLDAQKLWSFLESAHVSKVEVLKLQSNRIGVRGVRNLTRHGSLGHVRVLDLGFNRIQSQGAKMLAESDIFENLESLLLERNELHASGAIELATAPWMGRLRELDLTGNDIEATGVKAILQALSREEGGGGRIERLVLDGNSCDGAGDELARLGGTCTSLRELELRGCALGDMDCRRMGSVESWRALEKLDLSRNKMLDMGACEALLRPNILPRLSRLYLGGTAVHESVVRLLDDLPTLEYVELPHHAISSRNHHFRMVLGH